MRNIQNALVRLFSSHQTKPLIELPQGAAMAFLLPVQLSFYARSFYEAALVKDLKTSALAVSANKKYAIGIFMRTDTALHYDRRTEFTCPRPLAFDRTEFLSRPSVTTGLEHINAALSDHVSLTFRDLGASPAFKSLPEDLSKPQDEIHYVTLDDVYYMPSSSSSTSKGPVGEVKANGTSGLDHLNGLPVIYPKVRVIIDRVENVMRFVEELSAQRPSPLYAFVPHVAYSVASLTPVRFIGRRRYIKSGLLYRLIHQRYPGTHVWVENDPILGPDPVLLDGQSFYDGDDCDPPPFPENAPTLAWPSECPSSDYSYATVTVMPRGIQPVHDHTPELPPTPYVANPYTGVQGSIGHG